MHPVHSTRLLPYALPRTVSTTVTPLALLFTPDPTTCLCHWNLCAVNISAVMSNGTPSAGLLKLYCTLLLNKNVAHKQSNRIKSINLHMKRQKIQSTQNETTNYTKWSSIRNTYICVPVCISGFHSGTKWKFGFSRKCIVIFGGSLYNELTYVPSWIFQVFSLQWLHPWAVGPRPHAGRQHFCPVFTGECERFQHTMIPDVVLLCFDETIYGLFAAEPRSCITWCFGWRHWETVHSK